MLLQALVDYAETRLKDQLDDPAFERKPVPLLLEISKDGRFLGWVPQEDPVVRGKKTVMVPREHVVPRSPVNRNSGVHPLLAFDDAKYLFGPGPWTNRGQEEDHRQKHEGFVALIRAAQEATDDEALGACLHFYDNAGEVEKAKSAFDQRTTGGILLSVSPDGPVVDRAVVRDYWREVFKKKLAQRNEKGGSGMCLISGEVGPIAPTHDLIKGATALGGQPSGVALMSFDKDSFRSYGWEKNANSPVSPERARAYVAALNDLMAHSRVVHNGVGFLYWTREPSSEDVMKILNEANPEAVRLVLTLHRDSLGANRSNEFCLLAVSGNGGRLLVRSWFEDSLDNVLRNVGAWFEGLSIVNVFTGEAADAPPLWQVLKAIARDEAPPDREIQLIRRAITGTPVGNTILAAALARMRLASGADRISAVRAGLTRLAVNDMSKEGERALTKSLDAGSDNPAYLCGRLLALHENLQWAANRQEVAVTVADKYFSMASTYPALAMPRVMDLGRKHLQKLRRDNRGAAIAIEREIQAVLDRLASEDPKFPGRLTLEQQGRFVIGFYHQRAESIARGKQQKQARQQGEKE